jgi:peptide deformylase
MAVLKVARLGHPILRQVAEPVSPEAIAAPEIQRLIDDMLETMEDHDGAGLAAPQVHVSCRVVIYGVAENPRYPDAEAIPLTVLINPKLTPLSQEQEEDWEGCLSVPDLRGMVPRFTQLRVEGLRARRAAAALHRRGLPRPRGAARVRPPGRPRLSRPHALHGHAHVPSGVRALLAASSLSRQGTVAVAERRS